MLSLASLVPSLIALALAEAASAAPGTVESVAAHVEQHTTVWLIVAAAVGPILGIILLVGIIVRFVVPIYREENKANRDLKTDEGEKTRQHIKSEMDATRNLADEQHKRIIDGISGKVDKLHDKIDDVRRTSGEIARKLGVVVLTLLMFAGSCATILRYRRPTVLAETCNPPCSRGRYCCGKAKGDSNGCCEERSDTATDKAAEKSKKTASAQPDGGHSQASFASLSQFAGGCNRRAEVCL